MEVVRFILTKPQKGLIILVKTYSMIWKTLNGQERNVSHTKYVIDWEPEKEVSKLQGAVKKFLRPYWENDLVLEEFRIPASRLRVDLINVNKSIMVEVNGRQHNEPSNFMHGSLAGFRESLKRDLQKETWAELNNLKYIVIEENEVPLMNKRWFETTFGLFL